MRGLARHWGALLLLAAAAPLMVAFTWQHGIASMSDDSVSYLVLARWMDGTAGTLVTPWLPWHRHFAPLFPLALAATGGAQDLARANLVVALFAVAAIAAVYRFVFAVTLRRDAAFAVTLLFMLTPTAWLSAKGILSEAMYLFVSMEALRLHAVRIRGRGAATRDVLWIGIMLGIAYLTRTAAVALLAAYFAHVLVRWRRDHDARPWLAFVPAVLMALAWIAVRPHGEADVYAHTAAEVARAWATHASLLGAQAVQLVFGGWVSSFTGVSTFTGDAPVPLAARCALGFVGLLALGGALLRARENALDGWYVLATLALLFAWIFDEENMRRLLYPIVPLMLMHAGMGLVALSRRLGQGRHARLAATIAAVFVAALSVPAVLGIASKARDTAPLLEGHSRSAADMTEYFRIANTPYARAMAAKHAASLTAFESLARLTPPGARVMYVRPEYVAVLGAREGAELDYAWDARALATAVRDRGAGFILATSLAKTDLAHERGDAMASVRLAEPYTRRALVLSNAKGQDEVVLLEVDRDALTRFLGERG
ncbi:MAG TPA: hypothetical protein VM051_02265 [Usitatibacter sp.]|nr:hypothetical protein [Usitatibacter sp.]